MSHFYLTLPSNSSMNVYPTNTLTHYTTKLQAPISLTGEWEVALEEISLPYTWHQLPTGAGRWTVERKIWPELRFLGKGEHINRNYEVPPGDYTITALVDHMNDLMTDDFEHREFAIYDTSTDGSITYKKLEGELIPQIQYDSRANRVYCHVPVGFEIKFSQTLTAILGFDDNQLSHFVNTQLIIHNDEELVVQYEDDPTDTYKVITADKRPDISAGIHHIYVYCDILESIAVGDTLAPLLRIVETKKHHGGVIHDIFNPPRYLPVQKKNFGTIEIDIRTDFGAKVPFESGKVVCTLHFRRSTSHYFL